MRIGVLTLVICLLASSAGLGQDWAKAMIDKTSHDFGTVARGAKVEHRFTLENLYVEAVHIEEILSSCKCISTEFSSEPLKTYEKTEILVKADTRKFLGRKQATLKVKLDRPFPAVLQLHVYCYIRSDVVFEPGVVEFGSVEHGTGASRKLTVSYAGRSDWQILSVESANPHLQGTAKELSRTSGQVTYELSVALAADAPVGYIRDHLMLTTDDPNRETARVPLAVEGVVAAAVSASPSPLPLGVLKTHQAVTRNLVVRAKKPFRILEVSCKDERFQFALPEAAKPVQLIPVTFTAGDASGRVAGEILIRTDKEGSPSLTVKVNGLVLPATPEEPSPPDTPTAGTVEISDGWRPAVK